MAKRKRKGGGQTFEAFQQLQADIRKRLGGMSSGAGVGSEAPVTMGGGAIAPGDQKVLEGIKGLAKMEGEVGKKYGEIAKELEAALGKVDKSPWPSQYMKANSAVNKALMKVGQEGGADAVLKATMADPRGGAVKTEMGKILKTTQAASKGAAARIMRDTQLESAIGRLGKETSRPYWLELGESVGKAGKMSIEGVPLKEVANYEKALRRGLESIPKGAETKEALKKVTGELFKETKKAGWSAAQTEAVASDLTGLYVEKEGWSAALKKALGKTPRGLGKGLGLAAIVGGVLAAKKLMDSGSSEGEAPVATGGGAPQAKTSLGNLFGEMAKNPIWGEAVAPTLMNSLAAIERMGPRIAEGQAAADRVDIVRAMGRMPGQREYSESEIPIGTAYDEEAMKRQAAWDVNVGRGDLLASLKGG
jgi:hypothetical protein